MTRINLIPPGELHRMHLQAEYFESVEIFRLVRKNQLRNQVPDDCPIPDKYCFGTGHKTFFYNKLLWLANRYKSLAVELRERGYSPNEMNLFTEFVDLEAHWWGDWTPSDEEIEMSRERIRQREIELNLAIKK